MMALKKREITSEITKTKLLLVEGKDEVNFFQALLRKKNKFNEVQIIEVGGKEKFKQELPAVLLMRGFTENVNSIAIVRDADTDYQAAFQSAKALVEKHGLVSPNTPGTFKISEEMKTGIYIMPGDSENGMLEDLCLRTQIDHPLMQCVETFFQCVAGKEVAQPKNLAKAKSLAFLSVMPEISNSVGLAAQKGYWELDHDALTTLNQFIEDL